MLKMVSCWSPSPGAWDSICSWWSPSSQWWPGSAVNWRVRLGEKCLDLRTCGHMTSAAMKSIAALLTAATLTCCVHAAEDGAVWSSAVATRASDGHRIVYRYRDGFGPSFKRSEFPDRVIIVWRYKSPAGLPATVEGKSMDRFEDLLAPYVETPSVSHLVIVSTGDNLREWTYYTRSKEKFMAKMNEALRNDPRFPVEITLWTDPEWKVYEEFRKGVQR